MKATLSRFSPHRWLLIILAAAFCLRLATALWLGDTMAVVDAGGTHDQVSYDMLAQRVADGYGFTFPVAWYPWVQPDTPTSYYSGTMVLHLALIYKIFGYHPLIARLFYVFLGTATVYLVFRLGSRLFGTNAGLVSAAFAAAYAYLILYSATLLTETPFILFLLLVLDTSYALAEKPSTGRFILLGVALAGCILFRMAVLPFALVLLVWIHRSARTADEPIRIWQLLIPLGLVLIAIAPWTVRNYLLYDRFMLLESQFGHVFWNSNHPEQGTHFRGSWVAPIPPELHTLNEADLTNTLLRIGITNVLAEPKRFLLLTLSRIRYFFTFWPTTDSQLISNAARVLSFGIALPFMIYGLVISIKQWRHLFPIYLFLIFHFGVYLSSWVMIRYRIPADTVLLLFVGPAVIDIYQRLSKRLAMTPENLRDTSLA